MNETKITLTFRSWNQL